MSSGQHPIHSNATEQRIKAQQPRSRPGRQVPFWLTQTAVARMGLELFYLTMAAKKEEKATPTTAPQILKTGGTPAGPTYLSSLVNPSWPSGHLMVQKDDDKG